MRFCDWFKKSLYFCLGFWTKIRVYKLYYKINSFFLQLLCKVQLANLKIIEYKKANFSSIYFAHYFA